MPMEAPDGTGRRHRDCRLSHSVSIASPARQDAPPSGGVPTLLLIAAHDGETIRQVAARLGQTPQAVRQAAAFFIEQILLDPDADSYRVLGTTPVASSAELRRNMALLLRWLHPDLDPKGERSIFAQRVTRAWNDLKTEDRRTAYDQSKRSNEHRKQKAARAFARKQAFKPRVYGGTRYGARTPHPPDEQPRGFFGRALLSLLNQFAP